MQNISIDEIVVGETWTRCCRNKKMKIVVGVIGLNIVGVKIKIEGRSKIWNIDIHLWKNGLEIYEVTSIIKVGHVKYHWSRICDVLYNT